MSQEQEQLREVREAAMRCLSRRDYGFQELRRALVAKGYASALVDDVLENYRQQGLQSDERFAEMFVRSRAARGHGPQRISMELKQKGVEESLISGAFHVNDIDWLQIVIEQKRKKFGRAQAKTAAERAKQWRFLQYRGFSSEMIREALNEDIFEAL